MGVEKKICLKKIQQFYTFYPNITSTEGGWGSWNLQVFVSLPYRCSEQKLVKIDSVVLEKMTEDGRRMMNDGRWMTDYEGRQPIAIGHLSHKKSIYFAS